MSNESFVGQFCVDFCSNGSSLKLRPDVNLTYVSLFLFCSHRFTNKWKEKRWNGVALPVTVLKTRYGDGLGHSTGRPAGAGQAAVQSVGEKAEHCPWPEKQGSHSSFIPPLILVLHFICFHSLRSPSYFQWSTWGQRDVRAACGCTCTHARTSTRTHTRIHLGIRAPAEKRQVHPKGPSEQ